MKMLHLLTSHKYWYWLRFFFETTASYKRLGPIIRWRIEPTAANYHSLPLCYRPSEVQLTTLHWPIIDWLPYPGLRDKLILGADSLDLETVCEELWKYFCIEHDGCEDDDEYHDLRPSPPLPHFTSEQQSDTEFQHSSNSSNSSSFPSQYNVEPPTEPTTNRKPPGGCNYRYRLRDYLTFMCQKPSIKAADCYLRRNLSARFLLVLQQTDGTAMKIGPEFFKMFPELYIEEDVAKGRPRSIFRQEEHRTGIYG
ncbi:hypothetical protein MMC08_005940 [Hypocenomyce scalaris]|nr:hypothetical protein [Hypocenomyce scalaris]